MRLTHGKTVLLALASRFTLMCAWLFLREEHIDVPKAAGVALGFFGVLLIARPWSGSGGIDVAGVAYMMAGSLSVGCSFVYARKFITPLDLPAAALTTYQIGLAMVFLLVVTDLDGIDAVFRDTRAWIGLVLGLGLCGTGLAYLAYYDVVANLGAVAASGVTYIPPVVALLIGAVLVGDEIHPLTYRRDPTRSRDGARITRRTRERREDPHRGCRRCRLLARSRP